MDEEEKVRLFIAIQLPEDVRWTLAEMCEGLKMQLPKGVVRWVQPDKMHLTLRFLGDTAVSKIPSIVNQLDQLQSPQIRLQLAELDCFPNKNKPRVLWVGLKGEMAELQHLKLAIDQKLLPLGWSLEAKRYHPHITLGRMKDKQKGSTIQWGSRVEQVHFRVTAVNLIQSILQKEEPIYITLYSIRM